jgi:hypothetical protein
VTQRDRIVVVVVATAALILGFFFLVLGPKRDEASKVSSTLSAQRDRLTTAQTAVSESQAAKSSYAANYTAVAHLGKAVPADDDVPSLVYQLDSVANSSGVDFRAVKLATSGTPPPTTALQGAAATADKGSANASGSTSATNTTSTSTTSTTATAAAPATPSGPAAGAAASPTQAATAGLPPGAVVGAAGLATMPFQFTFNGSFFHLADFLGKVQRFIATKRSTVNVSGRLLQIDGIALTASPQGFPHMQANVAATTYLLPASQGLTNGASPSGPGTPVSTTNTGSAATPAPATAVAP